MSKNKNVLTNVPNDEYFICLTLNFISNMRWHDHMCFTDNISLTLRPRRVCAVCVHFFNSPAGKHTNHSNRLTLIRNLRSTRSPCQTNTCTLKIIILLHCVRTLDLDSNINNKSEIYTNESIWNRKLLWSANVNGEVCAPWRITTNNRTNERTKPSWKISRILKHVDFS